MRINISFSCQAAAFSRPYFLLRILHAVYLLLFTPFLRVCVRVWIFVQFTIWIKAGIKGFCVLAASSADILDPPLLPVIMWQHIALMPFPAFYEYSFCMLHSIFIVCYYLWIVVKHWFFINVDFWVLVWKLLLTANQIS
jgi:hypothetical protein